MENALIHTDKMTARQWAADAGVAAAAFAVGCLQLMLAANLLLPDDDLRRLLGIEALMPSMGAYVALALTTFPLAARRWAPWPVFVFVLVAFTGLQSSGHGLSLSLVGPMVALFTIASECSRAELAGAAAASAAALLLVSAPGSSSAVRVLSFAQNALLMAAAGTAGYALRAHRGYLRAMSQRAEEAERTREEEAARRVEEERVRIAREVHDITAHSLSAVSIQTAAAERLIERDPAAAREAVAAARATAKEALDEIRGMIGVLRTGDAPAETAPAAGTGALSELVEYLKRAGVSATLDAEGYDRSRVPAYVDMALAAIAREAATNIVRHAGAASATIRLRESGTHVVMAVENGGACQAPGALVALVAPGAPSASAAPRSTASPGASGGGHGIEGMRERARLLGGSLEAGPRPGGGFQVIAKIPLQKRKDESPWR